MLDNAAQRFNNSALLAQWKRQQKEIKLSNDDGNEETIATKHVWNCTQKETHTTGETDNIYLGENINIRFFLVSFFSASSGGPLSEML